MADKKKNMFAGLAKTERTDTPKKKTPVKRVEVKTKTKVYRKTGRPKTFEEETDRLTVDIPVETLIQLKQFLPASRYKTLAHVVNTALVALIEKESK